jgi:cysteine synthase
MILKQRNLLDPWKEDIRSSMIQVSPDIYAKLETSNPTGSVKDRLIQHVVKLALKKGKITSETVFVEATSGNTGISLSAIAASLGLKTKIIMPENMSEERRQMMRAFGAEILNVGKSDFAAAIEKRNEMVESSEKYWSPMQFENMENVECHRIHTGPEIIDQLDGMPFAAFVSGAGTGGTIMGVRRTVLERGLKTHMVLTQPAEDDKSHGIQGINDGADFLAKPELLDMQIKVTTSEAINRAKQFAKTRGVLIGISAGANLCAAEKYSEIYKPMGAIVTMLCDRGERYFS